jgi:ribosomal protein S18 acetylase RimI-like enzyme
MSVINIDRNNIFLVENFIKELKKNEASKTFRYFLKRTIDVLQNHVLTLILTNDKNNENKEDNVIGYAHLDKENEGNIWFGVCILDNYQGKGYGKILIEKVLEEAKAKEIKKIKLSVDEGNSKAYLMYKKYGFEVVDEKNDIIYMEHYIK